jgi:uncharacterized protein (TIGR02001 family)
MKKLLAIIILLLPTTVWASEIFSGSVAASSDYLWRGYSQNNEKVAVSGGIEVAIKGLTVGAWASQVDFEDDANYEYDYYVDYSHSLNNYFGFSAGMINYNWDNVYDTINEGYFGVNVLGFSATYYQDLKDSDFNFVSGTYTIPFITLFDISLEYGKATGFDAYQAINVSKDLGDYTFGGQVGTEESMISISYNF